MGGEHQQRGVGPKIAALLGRPEASAARLELEACERVGVSPSQFRGRASVTTYLYDGDRLVSTVTSSPWTPEDRALLAGWRMYQQSLHEACGHPKETAFHPDNEGWFESTGWVTCWACTAGQEPDKDGRIKPVRFPIVVDTRDYAKKPLPPWPDLTAD